MVPISRKRSTPSQSDDDSIEEPTSKRICVEPTLPQTPPLEGLINGHSTTSPLFDDDPQELLMRSVALAFEHVGFDGASAEALEAICAQVNTYVAHLLYGVTSSMLNARRSQPTPLDFKYALSRFDLPLASLEAHLKPPVSASWVRPELETPPTEESRSQSLALLLGGDLSGEPDKKSKLYIPKRFPSFPSQHTYKWTKMKSTRETDPRKIREEAAKAARQGEEALRRLVKVSKAGNDKDLKRAANRDPRRKERHEMWEKAMADLLVGKRPASYGQANQNEDRSMIVNAEKQYWRKVIPAKRKLPTLTHS